MNNQRYFHSWNKFSACSYFKVLHQEKGATSPISISIQTLTVCLILFFSYYSVIFKYSAVNELQVEYSQGSKLLPPLPPCS